ncbi:vacuolar protein sorting 55 [Pavlovales sp. CCMP2436]|nr:vacuolar protein sorting 55 [Pavlovales sp. CCMP2436]|mmetsp:Transcript_30824/g.71790  ORF Transcript_30824/g.71790 Transcript_30824/m.71790 type:complete len:136 (-) Transcript_30824:3702-4109(-)
MTISVRQLATLAFMTSVCVMLYILPLIINHAFWSLLALLPLLFAPVPWFFVPQRDSLSSAAGEDQDTTRHWAEFVSSFGTVGVLAIPFMLWHVGMIGWLDVVLSCCGTLMLFSGCFLFLYWQSKDANAYGRGGWM